MRRDDADGWRLEKDVLLLASLEVEAAVPWTVSETELAAFLECALARCCVCCIRLGRQAMLDLLNCVHCDDWIVLKVVFV